MSKATKDSKRDTINSILRHLGELDTSIDDAHHAIQKASTALNTALEALRIAEIDRESLGHQLRTLIEAID